MSTSSSHEVGNKKREKRTEREKLLGSPDEVKPRIRSPQEIIAKYRKAVDATSMAAYARNKQIVQRQEKLEKVSKHTEELEGRSEDYASLANQLLQKIEKRKWWQL